MEQNTLDVWCAGQDWCPVTATANLIGKKWHPVIIHRLQDHGPLRFNELKTAVDGISSKVLSESLDDLQEKQLVEREIVSEDPEQVRYCLTAHGEDLEPVIEEMAAWGERNLEWEQEEHRTGSRVTGR